MAKKPFPFSVCKDCCGTINDDDLKGYVTEEELENKGYATAKYVDEKTKHLSNTLKGYVKSEGFCIDDISPLEKILSVKVSGDDSVDLSDVVVNKYGKNLFDGVFEKGIWGGTNGVGYNNDTRVRCKNFIEVKEGITYSFSFYDCNPTALMIYEYDKDYNYKINSETGSNIALHMGVPYTPSKGTKYIHFAPNGAVSIDLIDVMKCQMEVGTVATEYEPYIEPVNYTVEADGTVEGLTVLYPSTTLVTDTPGVVIECEYNKDINKAFAELQNAIISLGGNV